MAEHYSNAEEKAADKAQLEAFLVALDAAPSQLQLDDCLMWAIQGKRGYISTWGDGCTWLAYIATNERARAWTYVKRSILDNGAGLAEILQDGSSDGVFHLLRLPTPKEADYLRELTGLRKRRVFSEDELARRREWARSISRME